MRTPEDVVRELDKSLHRRWNHDLTDAYEGGWPCDVPLGKPSRASLEGDFDRVRRWALGWRDWAAQRGLTVRWQDRRVIGTRQSLPSHVLIPDIDAAARLVGGGWKDRLATARTRLATLRQRFPAADMASTLRSTAPFSDTKFDLFCRAASWFADHDAAGLTARQVPIEGLHGKWLNTNLRLVRHLAGKDDLGLIDRPRRVHFTYLDLDHRRAGGRVHDSTTIGDVPALAYEPRVVLITENKDTAVFFPPVRSGIVVEGAGFEGASTLGQLAWLRSCPRVLYWGDIDAAGYEIVNCLRSNGVDALTILMDEQTYASYEKYGAWTDHRGQSIPCSPRKLLPHLGDAERTMYKCLTDPGWRRVRRIEQERVPLQVASHLVRES
ncbi:MAG: DUF2220 family protein [Actinomycetota bacterium]|nr:DUF2220 family protein [Actinomycetota bacterium]